MYYTIYKTTNTVNGKIYVGMHKTKNLNDGYLGSGSSLKKAVLKYGKKSFKKEILHIFDNKEDMIQKEQELVDLDFVLREDTYNMITGGRTALGYRHTEDHKDKMSRMMRGSNNPQFGKKQSEETKKKRSESILKTYAENPDLKLDKSRLSKLKWETADRESIGKKISDSVKGVSKTEEHKLAIKEAKAKKDNSHTEETRKKISESMKGKKKPEGVYIGCQKGKKKNFKTLECPHCGKVGKGPAMHKYHMDKCKSK